MAPSRAQSRSGKKSQSGGVAKKHGGQVKTKRLAATTTKKKKERVYTEEELGIPKLNMITPAGIQKPKRGKKGKVFVDDQESMMTILSMVNADKEGQIESKMMKARQMEELREARRKEQEAREERKRHALDETKEELRKRKRKGKPGSAEKPESAPASNGSSKPAKKKKVSFG
ncbi:hypothetical protein BDY21DRAFT_366190 [Lineolata rhizophorae]|uniref:60S ribosomal subunit assembly/export protein loc1 n=1 Tax=Lineolata rhizophorae TaxID=578093 RepID=A0A6A6NRQ3_9PEZI|nr:hypothetical protein BDY21DRAFT_366190 [Lineolata rhizophorae]